VETSGVTDMAAFTAALTARSILNIIGRKNEYAHTSTGNPTSKLGKARNTHGSRSMRAANTCSSVPCRSYGESVTAEIRFVACARARARCPTLAPRTPPTPRWRALRELKPFPRQQDTSVCCGQRLSWCFVPALSAISCHSASQCQLTTSLFLPGLRKALLFSSCRRTPLEVTPRRFSTIAFLTFGRFGPGGKGIFRGISLLRSLNSRTVAFLHAKTCQYFFKFFVEDRQTAMMPWVVFKLTAFALQVCMLDQMLSSLTKFVRRRLTLCMLGVYVYVCVYVSVG
jgi:hypothetical protein